ncbi:MAG: gamma-glutamyl-phosphate reductase, partial [Clostridia bacterium]|nr:gamma-glutamyl-phosphate reductase [Clostridia bacterium]
MEQLGIAAKKAAAVLANVSASKKNELLLMAADMLLQNSNTLIKENQKDIENAVASGLSTALIDRQTLTEQRIADMATGLREIAAENDPVGEVVEGITRPNGIKISKVRVPLGVVGII